MLESGNEELRANPGFSALYSYTGGPFCICYYTVDHLSLKSSAVGDEERTA